NTTYFPEDRDRAYLWSTSSALVPLAIGDAESNTAQALSGDGNFAIGVANYRFRLEAARWNRGGELLLLGTLSGWESSSAVAVSGDGNVIGGSSNTNDSGEAFRWTPAIGMQPLGFLKT